MTGVIAGNQTAYHSLPVYLNLLHNAAFRALGVNLTIRVTNAPLALTAGEKDRLVSIQAFTPVTYIVIGFAFISAGVIQLAVKERQYGIQHQQLVSGVSHGHCWCEARTAAFRAETEFFFFA